VTAWGILSTARINRLILAGARRSDRMDVIAVASRDRRRAEAYAREYSVELAYGSYDALLEDPAVEAVYISLPNSMHVEWTLRALAARKHVLCEKPFSRRAHEVEEAFDLADQGGSFSRKASCGVTTRRRPRSPDWSPKARSGGYG
jgi:D-xylose 1-dehydrogenase (NADP+, D-xylono-1,5-lactone-forming)